MKQSARLFRSRRHAADSFANDDLLERRNSETKTTLDAVTRVMYI